jgi:hypothetical protein
MTPPADLSKLTIDDFTPHVDQTFQMHTPGGVVPLKLSKVGSYGEASREGGAFSLLFVAPQGPWQPQGIYPLAHPALGTMEIFLVPVGPAAGGNGYHATFT